jgi:hypothetical protein
MIENKTELKRIYHPYSLWEDYKYGFYNNCTGAEKLKKIDKVIEMFNDKDATFRYMNMVVDEWKYSCEHNLTNNSINKIAYIGQGACCLYAEIPSTVTMEAWSKLTKEVQERSDKLALMTINKWFEKNRNIQLCLNLD